MKKKKLKKLSLNKGIVSLLSGEDQKFIRGGENEPVTTSFGACTGFLCCPNISDNPADCCGSADPSCNPSYTTPPTSGLTKC